MHTSCKEFRALAAELRRKFPSAPETAVKQSAHALLHGAPPKSVGKFLLISSKYLALDAKVVSK